ncbi:MAG: helix-turn-helix domain-containing protein [Planctomycetota bacterium]
MTVEPNPHHSAGASPVLVQVTPLLVGVSEAGRMLGVSPKTIRRMIVSGELPSVMVGGRRLFVVADLTDWAAALPRENGKQGKQ